MTTVTAASTPSASRAAPAAKPAVKAGKQAQPAGAAVTVDVGAAARRQLAGLVASAPASATNVIGQADDNAVKSFDAMVAGRTKALSETLSDRFTRLGIPLDEPITLKLDTVGKVATDSPYRKKIEKLFEEDPELVKNFKDVASLHSMRAARKALDAFQEARRAAKDDDARDAAQGLYTARIMQSQALSGIMTLDDGTLRSASMDFVTKSIGEIEPPKASVKAEQAAARRLSLTV